VLEGRYFSQDLDQVVSAELAGSTAGRYERRQASLVHVFSLSTTAC